MGGIVKQISAGLALAVAGCSAPAPAPAAPALLAGPAPLLIEGLSVACDAAFLSRCDADGCAHEAGVQPSVPLSFSYDGATGEGSLCIATGCAAAVIVATPGAAAGEGEDLTGLILTAPLVYNEAADESTAGEPALFDGVLSLARSGQSFRITQQSAGGVTIWGGACAPANPTG